MNQAFEPKDLVVLVADKDMEETCHGLLQRTHSLGICNIQYDVFRHLGRDAGCRTQSHEFLRMFQNKYRNALVIFDKDGCGLESQKTEHIEQIVEKQLLKNGWKNRARVIVIDPELEIWICGWSDEEIKLRPWLVKKQFIQHEAEKPEDPKGAFSAALKYVRKPVSASLFRKLAENVSFKSCRDRAFVKLKESLQEWFPQS